MVSIVQSEILEDSVQTDGRRYIREMHIDDAGVEREFIYMAETETDIALVMQERAAYLNETLNFVEGNV